MTSCFNQIFHKKCFEQYASKSSSCLSLSQHIVHNNCLLFFFHSSHILPQAWEVFKLICVYKDKHQHSVNNHRHPKIFKNFPPPFIVHLNQTLKKKQEKKWLEESPQKYLVYSTKTGNDVYKYLKIKSVSF